MNDNLYHALNKLKHAIVNRFEFANKFLTVNYGIDIEKEEQPDPRDHIMGAEEHFNWKKIKESGNWTPEAEVSAMEIQKGAMVETMDCTKYGLNNAIQMLVKAKYNLNWNISNKYPGKFKMTSRRGNTLTQQLKIFKQYGIIFEEECPCDLDKENWDSYHGFIPDNDMITLGKTRMEEWIFGWDSVWVNETSLREAAKYSPLYLAGYAWAKRGMLYYSAGMPNHCFVGANKIQNIARDSYSPFIKNLAPEYKYYYVKRLYIAKKGQDNFNYQEIKKLLDRGWDHILLVNKCGEYDAGVYSISDKGVSKTPLKNVLDAGVKKLKDEGRLEGISAENFKKLI